MTLKNRCNTTTALAIALSLWVLSTDAALAAPPRSGSTTVTRTGPAGTTAMRQTSVSTNGHGGYSASSTLTGPAGNTASRQQSGSYNAATQTYSRSRTRTGPKGATANKTSTVTKTPSSH